MKVVGTLNIFDSYHRVARLYPGMLAIAPVLWTLASLDPDLFVGSALKVAVAGSCFLGSLTLLANIARWRGKHVESVLIQKWGGWPTTEILRHRDRTIDSFTKARYHQELEKICVGLKLPSEDQEKQNPSDADARYRSATKCLIEKRREDKYHLLHKENALYGFRRNLLGLKPAALVILSVLTSLIAIPLWNGVPASISLQTIEVDLSERRQIYFLLIANLCAMIIWIWAVRPAFVRQSSVEYAIALFRTID